MKTRRVVVPRSRIKRHYLHPEVYGESIVELDNGMISDVYTNEEGELDTDTNDINLINYLSKVKKEDHLRQLQQRDICLVSITKNDAKQIQHWFSMSPLKQYAFIQHSEDITLRYISHARTINSDVFLCKINDSPVGLVGYDIIDHHAILMSEMYEHHLLNDTYFDAIVKMLKEYVLNHYKLRNIIFTTFDFDNLLKESLVRNQFVKTNRPPIRVPTLTGVLYQTEYEYQRK